MNLKRFIYFERFTNLYGFINLQRFIELQHLIILLIDATNFVCQPIQAFETSWQAPRIWTVYYATRRRSMRDLGEPTMGMLLTCDSKDS